MKFSVRLRQDSKDVYTLCVILLKKKKPVPRNFSRLITLSGD